jgi:hypothetical protein
MTPLNNDDLPLVTRREGARFIRETLGLPVTKSTIDKKAMRGQGPPVAGYWGRRELYTRKALTEWALSHLSDEPKHLNAA